MKSIKKIKAQEASRKDKLALRNALKLSSFLETNHLENTSKRKDAEDTQVVRRAKKSRRRDRGRAEKNASSGNSRARDDVSVKPAKNEEFIGPVIPAELMPKTNVSPAPVHDDDDECAITDVIQSRHSVGGDVAVMITGENDIAKLSAYDSKFRIEQANKMNDADVMCVDDDAGVGVDIHEEGELSSDSGADSTGNRNKRKAVDDVILEVTSSLEFSDIEEEEEDDFLGKCGGVRPS